MPDLAVKRALDLARNFLGQYEQFALSCRPCGLVDYDEVITLGDYLREIGLTADAEQLNRLHIRFSNAWTSLEDYFDKTLVQKRQCVADQNFIAGQNIVFLKIIIEQLETLDVPQPQSTVLPIESKNTGNGSQPRRRKSSLGDAVDFAMEIRKEQPNLELRDILREYKKRYPARMQPKAKQLIGAMKYRTDHHGQ